MSNKQFEEQIGGAIIKAKAYLLSKYQISGPDLDDVLQEASLKAMKNIKSFRGKSTFYTWFISICKNEVKYFFRKKNKRELRFEPKQAKHNASLWQDPDVFNNYEIEDKAALIQTSLAKLSDKHREIIEVVLKHSGSSQDIANMLKIPVNSARTRLHYAKLRLKKLVELHAHKSNIQLVSS